MSGFQYKKNRYVCDYCQGKIITIDRDDGVTPFMTSCHATEGCKGMMESACYRIDQNYVASYEWYRPAPDEEIKPHAKDHVSKGGLLLRKIVPVDREAFLAKAGAR